MMAVHILYQQQMELLVEVDMEDMHGQYSETSGVGGLIGVSSERTFSVKTASKCCTTYVSATTERLFNIDTATKSTTASLWIAGATFSARE